MIIRILFAVLMGGLMVACCPTGTTVVLIPDASGKVGEVAVSTKAGATVLTKANESSNALKAERAPSRAVQLSAEEVKERFAVTLANEPLPPEHFTFHFETGKADILPEEEAKLAEAKSAIEHRKPCDVSVIGHADRVGNNAINYGISTDRAKAVANALTHLGVAENCTKDIRFYGESDPAVPTADEVPEPRNRRVEVEIR
jgi:outer membrane protein OmpA-like peptidoglycan-associated protein